MNASARRTVKVKICGLTRQADALTAESAGASYLGAIFAGGPRHIVPKAALDVLGPARAGVQRVGVFGSQSFEEIVDIASGINLDVLQIHGMPLRSSTQASEAETQPIDDWQYLVEFISRLKHSTARTVWPVLRVPGSGLPEGSRELAMAAGAIVLDAHVVGQLGGTGVTLNWSALSQEVQSLRLSVPNLTLVLAGGLNAENVKSAIELLDPDVVDVSSGVEQAPGVKDPVRIRQFVEAALGARESL